MKSLNPDDAAALKFGKVAKVTDDLVAASLALAIGYHPEDEDAVMSGAMTAVARFAIQQLQASAGPMVVTERDVVGYFIAHVQRAASILLSKPAEPAN